MKLCDVECLGGRLLQKELGGREYLERSYDDMYLSRDLVYHATEIRFYLMADGKHGSEKPNFSARSIWLYHESRMFKENSS